MGVIPVVITREPVGDARDRLPPGLPLEEVPGELLSASIGGNEQIGYYLVFRGTPDNVVKMLERVSTMASLALPRGAYKDHT